MAEELLGLLGSESESASSKKGLNIIYTCLDACLPLDEAGLFEGLLPPGQDIMVLRSSDTLQGHPPSDGLKSLLTAIHSMDAKSLCILRHTECSLKDGLPALPDRMVASGVHPSWLQGFDYGSWVKPIGAPEKALAGELDFLSSWSLIPKGIHLLGLLYNERKQGFTVIGDRSPGKPLQLYLGSREKDAPRIPVTVKMKGNGTLAM